MNTAAARHADRGSHLKAVSAFWARVEKYHAEKLTAAKAILEDVAKYQGEQAAVVIWARMTVRKAGERKAQL